jgi:hypothetical protein
LATSEVDFVSLLPKNKLTGLMKDPLGHVFIKKEAKENFQHKILEANCLNLREERFLDSGYTIDLIDCNFGAIS